MPVLTYTAIHTTPQAHLKYILNAEKNEDLKYATALNTSTDCKVAYENFKELFEKYDSEKYSYPDKSGKKQHIRIHSYIQSFDETVTPETAHKIGVEWAKEMFGDNRPVIISTHTNTGHVHNHIAVCPYDFEGKRFLSNKRSLAKGREISDNISRDNGVAVIENPSRKSKETYAEWLARKYRESWKEKMADDIDWLIISKNVTDIPSLISEMKKMGYVFTNEERLVAKPKNVKYGCCLSKFGYGYTRQMLETRIENKQYEMLGRKIGSDLGFQVEIAVCLKEIQLEIYRTKPKKTQNDLYKEVLRNAALLSYISEHHIVSRDIFENHLDLLDSEEKSMEQTVKWNRMGGNSNLKRNEEKLRAIKEQKKEASACFRTFLDLMENDYDRILRQEKAKRQVELYDQGYEIDRDGNPYIDYEEERRRQKISEEYNNENTCYRSDAR